MIFKAVFGTDGKPKARGNTVLSCEEGLVIKLARLATHQRRVGALDATLTHKAAAGMLAAQTYRRLAHACMVHGARGARKGMARHREGVFHGFQA